MRLPALEHALSGKGVFLEIVAADGLWVASLAGSGGRIILPGVTDAFFVRALKELDKTSGTPVRTAAARRLNTLALEILKEMEVVIEVRSEKQGSFTIKIWSHKHALDDHVMQYRKVTLWRALNEAIATSFATISAMHIASTLGH